MTAGTAAGVDRAYPGQRSAGGVGGEDQGAGRHAGAGRDQDRSGAGDLVDGGLPDLAYRLGDAVHAVDVGLAELAAVWVDRQSAAEFDGAARDEPRRLSRG